MTSDEVRAVARWAYLKGYNAARPSKKVEDKMSMYLESLPYHTLKELLNFLRYHCPF
jgi:hypothetical protein